MLEVLTRIEEVCKILAILGAGVWGYYRFFKGRTFRPRLELSASGVAARHKNVNCLICSVGIKNVGLSRVDIVQKGSGLRVSVSNVSSFHPIEAADWEPKKTFKTFEQHGWIEPGESVQDQILFGLPADSTIMRLEFRIVGKTQEWNCSSIVDCCFDNAQSVSAPRVTAQTSSSICGAPAVGQITNSRIVSAVSEEE